VLVVDDDNFLQCMAKETLEDLGYEVLTAGDGQQAIEVYERAMGRIDIVLLDMSMPRMNGTDCFVELRRLDPNVRVVVTSGHSSADVQEKMTELGMTIQLPKPYQRAELSKALSFAVR
jgi:CheY-like chemotaxis protein